MVKFLLFIHVHMTPNFSETWHEDKKDPDNWLKIPEFGVMPEAVSYEGFAIPIMGPVMDDPSYCQSIRSLVKKVRDLARSEFSSLKELFREALVAMDMIWPADGKYPDQMVVTKKHTTAFRYQICMQSLESALSQTQRTGPLKWRLESALHAASNLATAADLLVNWVQDKPISRDLISLERMRTGASIGGIASAKSRKANSRIPDQEELLKEKHQLIAEGKSEREVAGVLAKRYDCTSDYIRKALKAKKRD